MKIGNFVTRDGKVTPKNTENLVVFDIERKLAISCKPVDIQSQFAYAQKMAELEGGRLPDINDIALICQNQTYLYDKTDFLGKNMPYNSFIWTNHSTQGKGLLFECAGTEMLQGDDGYMLYMLEGRPALVFVVYELEGEKSNQKPKFVVDSPQRDYVKIGDYLNLENGNLRLSEQKNSYSMAMVFDVENRKAISLEVFGPRNWNSASTYALGHGAHLPDVYEICKVLENSNKLLKSGFLLKEGWTANQMGFGAYVYKLEGKEAYPGLMFDRLAECNSVEYHLVFDF